MTRKRAARRIRRINMRSRRTPKWRLRMCGWSDNRKEKIEKTSEGYQSDWINQKIDNADEAGARVSEEVTFAGADFKARRARFEAERTQLEKEQAELRSKMVPMDDLSPKDHLAQRLLREKDDEISEKIHEIEVEIPVIAETETNIRELGAHRLMAILALTAAQIDEYLRGARRDLDPARSIRRRLDHIYLKYFPDVEIGGAN